MNTNFIVFGLARSAIEPESTTLPVSIADALFPQPLIRYFPYILTQN